LRAGKDEAKSAFADDDANILRMVTGLLSVNFDIVATVSNGRHALEQSLQLDPDVIVLDVSMPELDGFQTLRKLNPLSRRCRPGSQVASADRSFAAAACTTGCSSECR
jgi:CheY-like chemotaxis protein